MLYANLLMSSKWDVTTFLNNLKGSIVNWGGIVIAIIGAIMIIYGAYVAWMCLKNKGNRQHSWLTAILLILIGGAFFAGGFALLREIGEGGKATLDNLGKTVIPFLR